MNGEGNTKEASSQVRTSASPRVRTPFFLLSFFCFLFLSFFVFFRKSVASIPLELRKWLFADWTKV